MDDSVGEEEEGRHVMQSYLNLVDLAGSEKAGQTGAEGSRYIQSKEKTDELSSNLKPAK